MAKRENHYESAFEQFLRDRGTPYVAVDEAKRSLTADASLKSLDFIVSPPRGIKLLVDVKGRKFPSGTRKQYWKNWAARDDLRSMNEWETLFGDAFAGVLVFAFAVVGELAPLPTDQLFEHRGMLYGFVGVRSREYAVHARLVSPKWDAVAVPTQTFRRVAAPIQAFL
ncbi:MAG: HYExAFE family protein [Planctomycetales bacterium]